VYQSRRIEYSSGILTYNPNWILHANLLGSSARFRPVWSVCNSA
jgi:hypothetical protein